jgi:hypothetical protein
MRTVGVIGTLVAAIIAGALIGTLIVMLGPKETVVCTFAEWPNSAFSGMFGEIDGANFTGCDVPTGSTWAVAGAGAATPLVATCSILLDRRRRDPARRSHAGEI